MKANLKIIDSMIYTQMKNHVIEEYGEKYSLTADNFSATDETNSKAIFPFVYFTRIDAVQNSKDLERDRLQGGLYLYLVKVFDNESQTRTRNLMNSAMDSMFKMGFESPRMSLPSKSDNIYQQQSRFQRNIDEGDTI